MPPAGRPKKPADIRFLETQIKNLSFLQSNLQSYLYMKCNGFEVSNILNKERFYDYLVQAVDNIFSNCFQHSRNAYQFYKEISRDYAAWQDDENNNIDPLKYNEVPFSSKYYIAYYKHVKSQTQIPIDIILVIYFFTISMQINKDSLFDLIRLVQNTTVQNWNELINTDNLTLETYLRPRNNMNDLDGFEGADQLSVLDKAYIHLYNFMMADLNGIPGLQIVF